MRLFITIWFAACALVVPARTQADIIVLIDDVNVFAGQTAIVGVYLSSPTSDIVSGFNLPLDFNGDGRNPLPIGFSYADTLLSHVAYANTLFDQPPSIVPANVDAIPTGTGSDITIGSKPLKLFDLQIAVAANTAVGTVLPIQILVPQAPLQSLFNISGPNNPIVNAPRLGNRVAGSITVVSVPEPRNLILLMAAAVCLYFLRVRTRIEPVLCHQRV